MLLFTRKLEQKMTREFLYRYYLVSLCETRRSSGSLVFYTRFLCLQQGCVNYLDLLIFFLRFEPFVAKIGQGNFFCFRFGIISVRRDWYLLKTRGKNSFKIILSFDLINKKQVCYFHAININPR